MKNNHKPEIRFPGYTGDWEQRKLGDLADFSKGNGYSKSDLTDEGKPVILYGRLYTKYETVIESIDTFTIEKEKSVISKGNEVIVPASGETSEDISRASAVSKPGIILGGDLNIVRPSNEIDPVFLALTISNGKQQKELSKRAQGKSVVHLHNSDLKEVNLLFPKKEEQTKIGNFFKKLDETIALHQQELTTFKQTKQGFLQKMFPKEGESVPEVRFPEFTGDWEQRKLGELVEIKSGWTPSDFVEAQKNDGKIYIKVDDLNYSTREQLDSKMKVDIHTKYSIIKKGSTIFPKRGAAIMTNKVRILVNDGYMDTNMMALEPRDIDGEFLYTLIDRTGLYKIADTSTIPQINNKHIEPYKILLPNLQEQKFIGGFFEKLDDIIALHQRELDALKETKKAFLQKMFV
ncbi:restriction endonuclease subunit S [Brevibacillus laterosporus]|uniref:restriction endonuclease subunit S n=1 Tax=Brevibacillus laterosporus TaxID=1465 RepID=UPI003D1C2EA1